MLFCINKYIRRPLKAIGVREEHREEQQDQTMVSASDCCSASACWAAPLFGFIEPELSRTNTTTTTTTASTTSSNSSRASRANFSKATASSLFPNMHFTNHESLPPLPDAASSFAAVYPNYAKTQLADRIRDDQYAHLSSHSCLDYTGLSLFSHLQMQSSGAFFGISYRPACLNSQVRYGEQETPVESAIKKRIMRFLNVAGDDYTMVCTANRTSAFKLLAESYPFHSHKRLLTVYDHESEEVSAMTGSAKSRGARVMHASFSWPGLRIRAAPLKKMIMGRSKKRKGLFVFPLQSRMTGARYSYMWMRLAQENGWHVALDASALGPKDMDALGLSLIQPDFIVCSFFKVLGEDPSGFAGLFIKRSSGGALESSAMARSIGVVGIVPVRIPSDESSSMELDAPPPASSQLEEDADNVQSDDYPSSSRQRRVNRYPNSEQNEEESGSSEIVELETGSKAVINESVEIECRGLDHADSLGLVLIGSRLRCITNWLVVALMKLRHPHQETGHSLVRIYGPRVKFDRGAALAFNVFDWKRERVEPALVQKLADRHNISVSCGFIQNIWFSDNYEERKNASLERRVGTKEEAEMGIYVVNVSLSFLTNFEDTYRLWAFVARFLDADFVEKERWRSVALNQKMVEV